MNLSPSQDRRSSDTGCKAPPTFKVRSPRLVPSPYVPLILLCASLFLGLCLGPINLSYPEPASFRLLWKRPQSQVPQCSVLSPLTLWGPPSGLTHGPVSKRRPRCHHEHPCAGGAQACGLLVSSNHLHHLPASCTPGWAQELALVEGSSLRGLP
jgi:hypothetical protein